MVVVEILDGPEEKNNLLSGLATFFRLFNIELPLFESPSSSSAST